MPSRPRPILAVRLIGPTVTVKAQATTIAAQLAAQFGHRATCRTSVHPARHAGESRVYITLTPKELPD
jgi:hypothetical protein